ncbi:MAG: phage terminase large subunit [Rickettsiales bacterium]|jgi:predicted phage terminase large subunit-like protein|nr:phage terminase large subunit [Rickettsiales bacterium]
MNNALGLLRKNIYHNFLNYFIQRSFYLLNCGVRYQHNWHIDALAEALSEIYRGNIRRLIINMPPRYLKSICVSAAFPAWALGKNPEKRIIVASYSEKLSLKHSLDTRMIMESDFFKEVFSDCILSAKQNEKYKFATTKNGFRFAASVGGTLTGEGGDILIVDDPHNPQQALSKVYREKVLQWFSNTFSSRLNDKKTGAIIIVMQRLHSGDLSGYLLNKGGWTHLNLQAINEEEKILSVGNFIKPLGRGELLFSEREGREELEKIKIDMGIYNFNAQYQQKPMVAENGMIRREWLKKYDGNINFDNIYLSFDTAVKAGDNNDYTVCTVWGDFDNKYYLVDVMRKRLEYPELKKETMRLVESYNPAAALIEDRASGQSLAQDLKRESSANIIPIKVNRDKITRFASVTPFFESGKIFIRENSEWLYDYEYELLTFPASEHDDQVDSTSQFLNWARERGVGRRINIRRL